jgi:GDP-mannose pyrophosphatase NudK
MIRKLNEQILHKGWRTLKLISFELLRQNGEWKPGSKEVYETGDAAAVLLYHKERRTVILTQQFRLATYLNGNSEGLLLEACAGKLDGDTPEQCAIRETEEETGYRISHVQKVAEVYVGPGAITELVHCFIAPYTEEMKVSAGGGLEAEGEDIRVQEYSFDEACAMAANGRIRDAKTVILLQYLQLNGKSWR